MNEEKPLSQRNVRSISIAILAMGGEGGGVLADWILDLAEHAGHLAQTTSVPGVAQRSGATIYYLELVPETEARKAGKDPVLALMPVPGDVDIVLASELMEAGRAVQRGLITPERTTLIASTHRVYAIGEKTALGDGIVDSSKFIEAGQAAAKRFIYCDMAKIAEETGSVISSVLFGALAGAEVLPFGREEFEAAIRRSGVAVAASLAAFAAGYERAGHPRVGGPARKPPAPSGPQGSARHPQVETLLKQVRERFPEAAQPLIVEGVKRLLDYQDPAYARQYLERLAPVAELDRAHGEGSFLLSIETARYLALWMSYEDTIRVADLKTRSVRFRRVREEVRAGANPLLHLNEFLHPRLQEICDSLPAPIGRWLLASGWPRRLIERFTRRGRVVRTSSLSGFLVLFTLARMKRWRHATLRYQVEDANIRMWLERICAIASSDSALAVEIAQCQRLVKGYSDTYERGLRNFNTIMGAIEKLHAKGEAASSVRALREAALADEYGRRLQETLQKLVGV